VLFTLLVASAPRSDAAREILVLVERTTELARLGDFENAGRTFIDYWFQSNAWDSMREELRAKIREGMSPTGARWDALLQDPVRLADLGALEMPALVLVGQNSTLPTRTLSELLIRALPNARKVQIRGVGHMAPVTSPDQVNPLIESFLRAQA
jgi:pimeloyl-ACP methyl ester carboxylesterase